MKISGTTGSIRQKQPGKFRRLEDGNKPFTHVNGQKLKSRADQEKSAAYVNNKRITTLQKGLGLATLKLFDSNAGLEINNMKRSEAKKGENLDQEYSAKGKRQSKTTQKENQMDQWV